jgi:hypothetical protein
MSVQPVAAWRQMQRWFDSQAAMTQQLSSAHDAANAAFAAAQSNYYQSLANLAAQAALTRIQNDAKAKSAGLQTLIDSLGSSVNKVA